MACTIYQQCFSTNVNTKIIIFEIAFDDLHNYGNFLKMIFTKVSFIPYFIIESIPYFWRSSKNIREKYCVLINNFEIRSVNFS